MEKVVIILKLLQRILKISRADVPPDYGMYLEISPTEADILLHIIQWVV